MWKVLSILAAGVLVLTPAVFAQQPAQQPSMEQLQETYRTQLEADRDDLYAMSRQERHQYISQFLQNPDRQVRRAFKLALEQVRSEWDIRDDGAGEPVVVEPSEAEVATRVAFTNITYDTGTPLPGQVGAPSQMVGNRFDTANGNPVEMTGTITMITFNMVNTFFGSVVWSLYTDVMGSTAMQVTSMARPGVMPGFNTLAVMSPTTMNAYANGTFLAGIWQFDPTMTGLANDTGTTGGQGHHGISLNDGAVGTMLTTVTTGGMGVNAVFRVSGNVATPVELMDFTIEKAEPGQD
ncbi:MAG: hypothetical protein AAGE94_16225 [Acidobacteriota bacterium]